MGQGFSLHIGLNNIDSSKYKGKYQPLRNAENDTEFYYQVALANHFNAIKLMGKDATSTNLLENLNLLAQKMVAGDLLFISYSGHGSRVKDLNGDEDDGYDEVLVLFDRLFIDDEFQLCWAGFKERVRIFFINDSCYNGTISRLFALHQKSFRANWADHVLRGVDTKEAQKDLEQNLPYYRGIKSGTGGKTPQAPCSIIHIAACQDNQLADDGTAVDKNGKFTLAVRKTYADGNFKGSYKSFFESVKLEMPPWQKPNWDTGAGKQNEEFINSPFLQI